MPRDHSIKSMNKPVRIFSKYFYWEVTLVSLGFILLYLVLAIFARGGILSTDIIGYTDASIKGVSHPSILNRYFNVFLTAFFLKLVHNPILALQDYWAFLISATCGLIYLAARVFRKHSSVLHGIVAVGLFLSISEIADTAGMPLIDVAAMFMVLLFATVMILSARRGHDSFVLVTALGFLFYLAFRTKETALPFGILFLGLGMRDQERFNWKLWLKRMVFVLVGMVVGMLFFIILNTIFLHNPLFGFRIRDFQEFLSTYASNVLGMSKTGGSDSWYSIYFFTSLMIPFVLYLVSAVRVNLAGEAYPGTRLVWLVPLLLIIFVTLLIGDLFGFSRRFIFPTLPVICFLAPQFMNLDIAALANKKDRWWAVGIIVIGLLLTAILRIALRLIVPHLGWEISSFLSVAFIPVILSIILGMAFYWKNLSINLSLVIMILVIAIISIPLVKNAKTVFRDQPNYTASLEFFYPFIIFQDQIQFTPDMKMLVATDYWTTVGMSHMVKDRNEISGLFNVYFGVMSTRENFVLQAENSSTPAGLLSTNFSYALLSQKDWNLIVLDPAITAQLEAKYQIIPDSRNVLVLLRLKSGYP